MKNRAYESKLIEDIISDCWKAVLKIEKFKLNDSFFDLSGNSLSLILLANLLEKNFEIKLTPEDLFEKDTVLAQSEYIRKKMSVTQSSIIVEFQKGEKQPLVLIHPLGGTLFSYMPLIKAMEKNRTVIGVQDPFFSKSLLFYSSIQELAAFYIKQLEPYLATDSLILGGYSSGGTIAFEMARQLMEKGKKIDHLFIFDGWAKVPFDFSVRDKLKKIILKQVDILKRYQSSDSSLDTDHWFEILQNRLEILIKHTPQPIPVKITLFTPAQILKEFNKNSYDDNGWQFYVSEVTVIKSNGNHDNMMDEENIVPIRKYFIEMMNQLP